MGNRIMYIFSACVMIKVRIIFFLAIFITSCDRPSKPVGGEPIPVPSGIIEGTVQNENGPLSGAIVRVQTTDVFTTTDDSGRFILTGLFPGKTVTITAWASGHYIGGGRQYLPGTRDVEISLVPHATGDNPDYAWLSAFSSAGDENNCQNCHSKPDDPASALPFDEWIDDAHARAARNPRFKTMYSGTDVYGNQSPPTRFGNSRDYGRFPLRSDPTQPYFGPGYKLDFPSTPGNCAACHTPVAAIDDAYGVDPTRVEGVAAEGIGCDFCHKVWNVRLNPSTGLPHENMPGVLSYEFRRPPKKHQFFAGPLDDVAPGEDVHTPIHKQSQYCAPCHFGNFWGTKIYSSFGEWLNSPYNAPGGKTCQDCHMPPGQADHFVRFKKGGKRRNSATVFSHRMPGAMDAELLQNAVTMAITARSKRDDVLVDVSITNDQTGHHVPTDSPLRQMILLVEASDSLGQALILKNGPVVPKWGGIGDPDEGYYAGLPGKGFAKILQELWTKVTPSGAYWNHTHIVSDNRLPAFAADRSAYTFAAPKGGRITLKVTLLFRRAFIDLMDQKSWDTPDIVMEQESLIVTVKEEGD